MALFGRKREEEEDPFAALRGDGSSPFGTPAAAAPAPALSDGDGARIVARRDTGVLVAGQPRAQLTIASGSSTFDTYVIVGAGQAADVGDPVDLVEADGKLGVRLRPELRPGSTRG